VKWSEKFGDVNRVGRKSQRNVTGEKYIRKLNPCPLWREDMDVKK
jgi:hypothetical protein